MSRKENRITHNSFYEKDSELDFETRTKKFTEYDFIRLFLSLLTKYSVTRIDSVKLGYQLSVFYKIEEFEDILVMSIKKQIEGDYVDMSLGINQANFTGLISNQIQSSNERIITISNANDIISSYAKEIVLKMDLLVNAYIKLCNQSLIDIALELHYELNGAHWDLDSVRRIYFKIPVSHCFRKDNPSNCDFGSIPPSHILKKRRKLNK